MSTIRTAALFLKYLDDNKLWADKEDGISYEVQIADLISINPAFKTTNGVGWARSDSGILSKYSIVKTKKGNRVVSIKLDGFRDNYLNKSIPNSVRTAVTKDKKCSVLWIGKDVECDHKNGRYNSVAISNKTYKESEFQPLSKSANTAKRTHCNDCKSTGKRFDATVLGYRIGWLSGSSDYNNTCKGCYWYDPNKFNSSYAEVYNKKMQAD